MKPTIQSGFTLWELLVTLLVAGVLLGLGVPNFMEFQRNGMMSGAANQFVTGILMARAEAIKRQAFVTLCASADPTAASPTCSPTGAGTNGGFIVWVDENGNVDGNGVPILTDGTDGNAVVDANEQVLMQSAAPGGTMNVWADAGYVSYGPNGWARRATGLAYNSATRMLLCDDRGNRATSGQLSSARAIRIEGTGRGEVLQERAQIGPAGTAGTALNIIKASAYGASAVCP